MYDITGEEYFRMSPQKQQFWRIRRKEDLERTQIQL